ncbi:MAG TPA: hypothetical protein VGA33_10120, partial [Thermoanaerobaculia bacterium]
MKRIDVGWWYRFGGIIRPLVSMPIDVDPFVLYVAVDTARRWLQACMNSPGFPLQTSYAAGGKLQQALDAIAEYYASETYRESKKVDAG